MEYMNIVRMQIKPGKFEEWRKQAQQNLETFKALEGVLEMQYVQTGENAVCVVGRWASQDALAQARPKLTQGLDKTRDFLEPINDELGVTDPVSGPVILKA